MDKEKKNFYMVAEDLTYKGKFYKSGSKISLTMEQKKSLIAKNLIK
jgi:hypothetical protein